MYQREVRKVRMADGTVVDAWVYVGMRNRFTGLDFRDGLRWLTDRGTYSWRVAELLRRAS
jgi:hypothetical protein